MYSLEWRNLDQNIQELIISLQQETPIKLGMLAKELGLEVKLSTLKAGISGEIRKGDNGGYLIKVNRHDSKQRQRFTLAHEISHFLMHKEHIGDGIVDDILYRSNLSDDLEAQANRLAADIIMPMDYVNSAIAKISAKSIEEKIEILASVLEVSVTALKIRLGRA